MRNVMRVCSPLLLWCVYMLYILLLLGGDTWYTLDMAYQDITGTAHDGTQVHGVL